ncbi:hypothetical protein KUTeg_000384 [Tegillarca granosa]|uniref:Uncharacterized protein n=1 Tax=Tegillarca granosa TaxID=220873 RepID=A0ABQ9G1R3_TEGGR|nr:hypothetical protein KUTeg_000384 [Tegillarca granosa]
MCNKKNIDIGILTEYSEHKDEDDDLSECEVEDTSSPTSILNTFNFLERQINSLLNKFKKLEEQNSACYELFNDKSQTESLTTHINNILEKSADLQDVVDTKTAFADDLMKERKIEEKLKKVMMKEKEDKINELQQVNLKLQKDYEKLNNRLEECEKSINNTLGECEKTARQSSAFEDHMTNEEATSKKGKEMEKQYYINEGQLQNQVTKPGYINDTSGQHGRFQAKVGLEKADIARLQELQAARERNKALLNKKQPNSRNYISQRSLQDLELPKIDLYQEVTGTQTNPRASKKNPYYQSKYASYH